MTKDENGGKSESKSSREKVGRRGHKREKPQTKIVIRHLPPTMTEEDFLKQIDPLPEHEFYYYAGADWSLGFDATCRAYITLKNYNDVFLFRDRFDGYVFVDSKGAEYVAIVEFAPFQGLLKNKSRRSDNKVSTIEKESHYQQFLAKLEEDREAASKGGECKLDFTLDRKKEEKITSTPLLQYLANKKEKRREERKKRTEEKGRQREEEKEKRRQAQAQQQVTKIISNQEARQKRDGKSAGGKENMSGGDKSGNQQDEQRKNSRSKRRAERDQRRREEYEARKRERERVEKEKSLQGKPDETEKKVSAEGGGDEAKDGQQSSQKKRYSERRERDRRNRKEREKEKEKDRGDKEKDGRGEKEKDKDKDRERGKQSEVTRGPSTLAEGTNVNNIAKPSKPTEGSEIEVNTESVKNLTRAVTAKEFVPQFKQQQLQQQQQQQQNEEKTKTTDKGGEGAQESTKSELTDYGEGRSEKDNDGDGGVGVGGVGACAGSGGGPQRRLEKQRSIEGDRRIRNKDRPSIAIYQPKARLRLSEEKEAGPTTREVRSQPTSDCESVKKEEQRSGNKKVSRYSERRAERRSYRDKPKSEGDGNGNGDGDANSQEDRGKSADNAN